MQISSVFYTDATSPATVAMEAREWLVTIGLPAVGVTVTRKRADGGTAALVLYTGCPNDIEILRNEMDNA